MNITEYNRRRKKAAQARRKQLQKPFKVVVYRLSDNTAVEIKRFSNYESAEHYAKIYEDNKALNAFIEF